MTNYPDNMGDDSHLDSDETGNKLSCGCYEEACECPKCKYCGEIMVQHTHGLPKWASDVNKECPNECEDDEE